MRYSTEFLTEKYKILPKNIRDVANSIETDSLIKSISEEHRLHIDIAEILYDEIVYVIFGAEKSVDFIKNLKRQTLLPDEKINAIAKDVNEKIFLPMRETMKEKDAENTYTDIEKADGLNAIKDEITQIQTAEREIHYPNLANSPGGQDIDQTKESEEIKRYINKQQNTKLVVPPPPNLPTGNLEAKPPSEKKRPYSEDPYREPTD